jgi:hypothetical protein
VKTEPYCFFLKRREVFLGRTIPGFCILEGVCLGITHINWKENEKCLVCLTRLLIIDVQKKPNRGTRPVQKGVVGVRFSALCALARRLGPKSGPVATRNSMAELKFFENARSDNIISTYSM